MTKGFQLVDFLNFFLLLTSNATSAEDPAKSILRLTVCSELGWMDWMMGNGTIWAGLAGSLLIYTKHKQTKPLKKKKYLVQM